MTSEREDQREPVARRANHRFGAAAHAEPGWERPELRMRHDILTIRCSNRGRGSPPPVRLRRRSASSSAERPGPGRPSSARSRPTRAGFGSCARRSPRAPRRPLASGSPQCGARRCRRSRLRPGRRGRLVRRRSESSGRETPGDRSCHWSDRRMCRVAALAVPVGVALAVARLRVGAAAAAHPDVAALTARALSPVGS